MAEAIAELLVTATAIDKLGARGITPEESDQLRRNVYVIARNPHQDPRGERAFLIGETDGGRVLTLVIERTGDPTTWWSLPVGRHQARA